MMSKCYRSELVGAFSNPIDENPTGVMEEAAFAAKNLDYRYLTIKVEKDDLAAALNGVRAFNMRGINLTIPHKVDSLHYLDELSDAAQIIGAVNMVVNNNAFCGEKTQMAKGFSFHFKMKVCPFQEKRSPSLAQAVPHGQSVWNVLWLEQKKSQLPILIKNKVKI